MRTALFCIRKEDSFACFSAQKETEATVETFGAVNNLEFRLEVSESWLRA